jgi:glutathione S-transferase
MQFFADTMQGNFLFGSALSAADCYLFVMLLWAEKYGLDVPAKLASFRDRMISRPSVKTAMTHEGLT